MKERTVLFFVGTTLMAAVSTPCALAQQMAGTIAYEYRERIDAATNIQPLGDDLFGDKTSYENGATTFEVTDVELGTNVKLPLRIGRTMEVAPSRGRFRNHNQTADIFGIRWRADVPYIRGDYLQSLGWVAVNGPDGKRCSNGTFSVSATNVSQIIVPAHNWFVGNDINIPGYGKERLLAMLSDTARPTSGGPYVGTTKSHWKVSCTTSIKNGVGEGFIVTLPDGAKYTFDWMASIPSGYITTGRGDLQIQEMTMYATKAVDRFGGSIEYTYSTTNPHQLTKIQSSDGVSISLAYDAANGKVSTISTSGRTWSYAYQQTALSQVTLPDGSFWTYSGIPLYVGSETGANPCDFTVGTKTSSSAPGSNESSTLVIKHPSGAMGEFSFRALMFGYNKVPGACVSYSSYRPKAYVANSLYKKTISGPGISAKTWNISYAPSWSYLSECQGCATTATTTVSESSGRTTAYVFGNDFSVNSGRMLSKTVSGGGAVIVEQFEYLAAATGQPFPDAIGEDTYQLLNNPLLLKNRPMFRRTLIQDGRKFVFQVGEFDQYVYPVLVTKTSSPAP
jgi:hypothetical protein